jgi:molybdate transport system substrate-binding protein
MMTWSKITAAAAAGCMSVLLAATAASAAEISVVGTGGPVPDLMGALVPMFERASGHKVTVKYQPAPTTINQLKEGVTIDVVVAGTEVLDDLVKSNQVATGASAKFMISRIGVGVRTGAPKPDISTPDALKAALLAAKSVAYSQGASGQHFLTVIQRLGLTDALKPKTVIVSGRPVGAAVASGEAEIGVQQVAELLPVAGVTVVGPLPGDLQKLIPYSAGVPSKAKEQDAAKAFVRFLGSEAVIPVLKRMGMDPAS